MVNPEDEAQRVADHLWLASLPGKPETEGTPWTEIYDQLTEHMAEERRWDPMRWSGGEPTDWPDERLTADDVRRERGW